MSSEAYHWWANLLHGGMLLDLPRLAKLLPELPVPLPGYQAEQLRREITSFTGDLGGKRTAFVAFVLEKSCGFSPPLGHWHRGSKIDASWTRRGFGGETIRPDHLWIASTGGLMPVFIDDQKRLGLGRGKRVYSHVLQWLRATGQALAVLTNGQQWRIVFAGSDFDAFVEWDLQQWFAEGEFSAEFSGFRGLLAPSLWTGEQVDQPCPLLLSIRDSRKGQSDLSQVLGERVRQAAEHLIQAHAAAFVGQNLPPADIYRAAVRMIMRMVVVLFAESRDGLLPRDNPTYYSGYSLHGLRELLERISPHRLAEAYSAWPRVLALFKLIYSGCGHEAMPVPAYGGELFAPGNAASDDPMGRTLAIFETACFGQSLTSDLEVRRILDLLTRTRIRIRQGRSTTLVPAPVDFSNLDNEYIGILYAGLLDFELHCARPDEPIVFLALGNQPSLPLASLEAMDEPAIKNLLEKFSKTGDDDEAEEPEEETSAEPESADDADTEAEDETAADSAAELVADSRLSLQGRAEAWARRACEIGKLVSRPRGAMTPEKRMRYEADVAAAARKLITKTVLPGEWYLARWGGTRKGAGTFYTVRQLAVPTVQRTLRPLAYDPPAGADGKPNIDAPPGQWKVKPPEAILALKVCDLACGSGSFPLASLRFLTDALYQSMVVHGRFRQHNGRDIMELIRDASGRESLASELLPCRPDDDDFEVRVKAILRRYVVERCIYGVDLDPLAVELCRLSLWIETLDRSLPMTFLSHKIKWGNALVGAWFDQFLHYPVMAWQRVGGDEKHSNGVHVEEGQQTKAIAAFAKQVKADLVSYIDGATLFYPVDLTTVRTGHDTAENALREIHSLGITEVNQRQQRYEALRSSAEFRRLQDAFDLWCALWFWPATDLHAAPVPSQFAKGNLSAETWAVVREVAKERRFFHWELEFPDVFGHSSTGFNAVNGNPPWEIAKPNSKEFFSAIDPLYRGYGKQEAINRQKDYFGNDEQTERRWIEYQAFYKAMSNWVSSAGFPYGDRVTVDKDGKKSHDLNLAEPRSRDSFAGSQHRHDTWKAAREESSGYADQDHAFRHQGSGDINLYKMFLEQAHAILGDGGRLGLIVPSGLYSDSGSRPLRQLFTEKCRWEWLFGFENHEAIFDIHRSFKFNPVIIQKHGKTEAIRTAFMRRQLADWEEAEPHFTLYPADRITRFSPKSLALLEIQSQRDLEVLTKIYANSVLLGDDSPDGWGVRYTREFDMTNDSKLFPPRPKWEEWGYQADEYSRWIKGDWQPIEKLYAELRVKPLPEGQRRCAQPPYDKLPIPRADIPAGVILSREATHFIREKHIPVVEFTDAAGRPLTIKEGRGRNATERKIVGPAVALPLYEGRMIGQFDLSEKGWVSGKGRSAVWREIPFASKTSEPQFAMGQAVAMAFGVQPLREGTGFMDVTAATNTRTFIASMVGNLPCGNKVPILSTARSGLHQMQVTAFANSLTEDYVTRMRLCGLTMNWFIVAELPLPSPSVCSSALRRLAECAAKLNLVHVSRSPSWMRIGGFSRRHWALTAAERMRQRVILDALVAVVWGLSVEDVSWLTRPDRNNTKGFWRVDDDRPLEQRLTTLAVIAVRDLQQEIINNNGDVSKGIEAFCGLNDGEGWMLPETLRLADYGLGNAEQAREHQPVRSCFGERFYDWQLAQSADESRRECHLHARNLLGEASFQRLLDEIEGRVTPATPGAPAGGPDSRTGTLFDMDDAPLFQQPKER